MSIRPELVAYIRTLVRGEHDENDRVEAQLDAQGWHGYGEFLHAVFFCAIDRRFAGIRNDRAIIRFVAEMRTSVDGGGAEIDPATAEAMIASVLDPTVGFTTSPEMLGKIQTLALYQALTDEDLPDDELDDLLAQATRMANSSR